MTNGSHPRRMSPGAGMQALVLALAWSGGIAFGQGDAAPEKRGRNYPAESNGWALAATVRDERLSEMSGLASFPATRDRETVWCHNDGGRGTWLHQVSLETGAFVRSIELAGVANTDWEDLATVTVDGQRFLAVADCGDNQQRRKSYAIHVVKADDLGRGNGPGRASPAPVARTIRFRYPDGPHDSEALAFDARARQFLIFTKSKKSTLLYAVPWESGGGGGGAEKVASPVVALAPPVEYPKTPPVVQLKRSLFGNSATAAALSPDGATLVILTYTDCLVYPRAQGEAWDAALARAPHVWPLPAVFQPEALCFSADGTALYVTSENCPAPVYRRPVAVADGKTRSNP